MLENPVHDRVPAALERGARASTLVGVLLAVLMVPMTMSGTSVALPAIAADLGGSAGAQQWVVTGYFLSASCLMLVAGTVGDLVGRRRIFRIGAVVYTLGTVVAALATDIVILDIARTVSGVGAAGLLANGAAVLAATFDGDRRTKVFAALGTTVGAGLAFGPTCSGLLIELFDWRGMLGCYAVVGALVIAATLRMPESRAKLRPALDFPGAALFMLAVTALMYATTRAVDAGWTDPVALIGFGSGAAIFVAFIAVERRSRYPLLDLTLVTDSQLSGLLLTAMIQTLGTIGVLVYLPAYLQAAGGHTAAAAGGIMLALTLPVLAVPPLASYFVVRGLSPRTLIVAAIALLALGNALLALYRPGGSSLALFGPLIAIGVGNGLVAGQLDALTVQAVGDDRVGMASGLLNTVRGTSNSLGLSVFGAILVSLIAAEIGDRGLAGHIVAGDTTDATAAQTENFTTAWQYVLYGIAALCAIGGVFIVRLLREGKAAAAPAIPAGESFDRENRSATER